MKQHSIRDNTETLVQSKKGVKLTSKVFIVLQNTYSAIMVKPANQHPTSTLPPSLP